MKKLSFLLLLILTTLSLTAQQTAMPEFCKNPPLGVKTGGAFTVAPEFACLDYTTNSATIHVTNGLAPSGRSLANAGYIFNFKDGDNIIFPSKKDTIFTTNKPGTYWILQGGNDKGQAYITCSSVEVIQTEQPDIKVSTCGDKSVTVTFLDTPKNQKYGKYRIFWGDGTQTFSSMIEFLPHVMTYSYINIPTQLPYIIAEYTRGNSNFTVCNSQPISFSVGKIKPQISELESLGDGSSVKITLSAGLDGNEYNIQQKENNGNWVNTGKKMSQSNSTTSVQQTIDSLKNTSEYCFRLQLKDSCGTEIVSNEVCKLSLKTTLLSDQDVKFDWNNFGSEILYYQLYTTDKTTTNPILLATIAPKNNSFTYSHFECENIYNLNLVAVGKDLTIKSSKVLVDFSNLKELPAPDNITTVAVLPDSRSLKYSIFESSGFVKPKYLFYRSVNGGNFEKVGESVSNFYDDTNVELEKNHYCYAYKYESECGVQSALSINKPCNIKLSIENTTLTWTPFFLDNSTSKVDYSVEFLDAKRFVVTLGLITENTYDIKSTIDKLKRDTDIYVSIPKFRILGKINYTLNLNGNIEPFPFIIYSNNVDYIEPALSTTNESEVLNIYPNPTEETIQFNSTFQLKTAEIIDLQGKTVEIRAIDENQISIKTLPKGKYILKLYDQNKKFIHNKTIIKM